MIRAGLMVRPPDTADVVPFWYLRLRCRCGRQVNYVDYPSLPLESVQVRAFGQCQERGWSIEPPRCPDHREG